MFVRESQEMNFIIEDDIFIEDNAFLVLAGEVAGDVFVSKGSTLVLRGTLTGVLTVEGVAEIRGVMNGDIFSSGKTVIFGAVHGSISPRENFEIMKGAVIDG